MAYDKTKNMVIGAKVFNYNGSSEGVIIGVEGSRVWVRWPMDFVTLTEKNVLRLYL